MIKENKIRVLRIYSILLSIVIVIAGLCLMAGCLSIYNSGDQPYSREAVAETFSTIAVPVYLCLIMTILGFVLEVLLPTESVKPAVEKNYTHILGRLYTTKDLSQCDEAVRNEITSLQKNRKVQAMIRTIVLVVASIVFFTYALNGNNFHESDINGSMIKAMTVLIPCLLAAFISTLYVAVYNEKSIQREIELLKSAPAAEKVSASAEDNSSMKESPSKELEETKKLHITRCAILAIGLFCLIYGFMTGGIADVLAKAINICTECIGLG